MLEVPWSVHLGVLHCVSFDYPRCPRCPRHPHRRRLLLRHRRFSFATVPHSTHGTFRPDFLIVHPVVS